MPAGFIGASLTPIPSTSNVVGEQDAHPNSEIGFKFVAHQKRSSVEMEDELTSLEAPPTKQQLSENKLFQQFGSLHIDKDDVCQDEEFVDQDEETSATNTGGVSQSRREFDRYVYLLFKDKESKSNLFAQQSATNSLVDRLLRKEREKLSKAVILWSPPLKDSFQMVDSDSDDDFTYKDHRDFLKSSKHSATISDALTTTEISDDDVHISMDASSIAEPNDQMFVE